jgi:hypothetical protein
MESISTCLGVSLVDVDGPAVKVGLVESLDGLVAIVIVHLNETETAGAAGVAIHNDIGRCDVAVLGEHFDEIVVTNAPRKIAYKELHGNNLEPEQSQGQKNRVSACDARNRYGGHMAALRSLPEPAVPREPAAVWHAAVFGLLQESGLKAFFRV